MDNEKYLSQVRDQYENYPYPKRDPEVERSTLYVTATEYLGKINHYCYGGKRDLRKGQRFLVAGGGTGDAAIYLAEQLINTDCEVVYLDLSNSSLNIARQRAQVRGLKNITWLHNSILELPDLDIGTFDYINCCGVLHHLEDPVLGLSCLSSVLKDDGCMGIMVYAKHGRAAIYMMQDLMRKLNSEDDNLKSCVDRTRLTLSELDKEHWYSLDASRWSATLEEFGDIEITDLFLHPQDRAYTVNELYEWINNGGLNVITFTGFTGTSFNYLPEKYIKDTNLLDTIKQKSLLEQQSISELLNGHIKTHTVYVTRKNNTVASPASGDQVPYYAFGFAPPERLFNDLSNNPKMPINLSLGENIDNLTIIQTPNTRYIMKYINGINTVDDIVKSILNDLNADASDSVRRNEVPDELINIINKFNSYDLMFLRDRDVAAYKINDQIIQEGINRLSR